MTTLNPQEIQAFQAIGQDQQPDDNNNNNNTGEPVQAAQDQPQPVKQRRAMDTSPLRGLKALATVIAKDNDPDKDYDDPALDKLWDEKGVWIGIYPQEHRAYKLELFIQHYISNGYNASKAAVSCGYCHEAVSDRQKNHAGATLRRSLRKQIRARVDNVALSLGITAQKVMQELASLAFSNIGDYLSPGGYGAVTDISALPREALAAVKEIQVDQIFEGRGDNKTYTGDRVKLKLHDKIEVLKLLGGHIRAIDIKPDNNQAAGGDVNITFMSDGDIQAHRVKRVQAVEAVQIDGGRGLLAGIVDGGSGQDQDQGQGEVEEGV